MQSAVLCSRLIAKAVVAEIISISSASLSSFQSKCAQQQRALRREPFHLVTVSSGISKTHSSLSAAKQFSFGDDACFVGRHRTGDVIGVADGVGGWRTYGIDPSIFPKSLMKICERMVEEGRFFPNRPVDILSSSFHEVKQSKEFLLGSCTACVVALHREEQTVYTANLGDSGYMVLRGGKIIHRSEEQQHYFNTPYQLSVAPSSLEGLVLSDSPETAQQTSFQVEEGDIILLGTDGLFDNMNDDRILKHLSKLNKNNMADLQQIANSLTEEAHKLAFDKHHRSPFSLKAAANGFNAPGGKPDDITVLLARVSAGNPAT